MARTAPRKSPAKAKKQPPRPTAPAKPSAPPAKAPARPVKSKVEPRAEPRRASASAPKPPVLEAEPVFESEPGAGPVTDPREDDRKRLPAGEPKGRVLPFEIDPAQLEAGLKKLQGELVHWTNKGRYTKVRFKFRGKQLLPDLPLAAVVAAEGLTFYWGGILRMLVANVVGRSVFEVELVNDADKRVQAGREALLSGDVDQALTLFREALAMDRDNPSAHLNVGVALKLRGDREGALAAFDLAKKKDPEGGVGAEAERLSASLRPKA
ncbi:tetratricopeptide repeat protein [Corallococcus praedator]|uniref:Tetratricopeptide repeat protein n=1 Tax=Corallococcus praedator TaxID=2316724 RepID=A0ABX9QEX8_9BACT|nr:MULTISPECIES: tetratricopeptide repeat protein [Corallococcus]RKH24656.1 tetratricopeptide repeat protein [Corallococcus sp. CA031C]RKI00888.1 tetratricopeptide repeat protein [Corallococcus praedator]